VDSVTSILGASIQAALDDLSEIHHSRRECHYKAIHQLRHLWRQLTELFRTNQPQL